MSADPPSLSASDSGQLSPGAKHGRLDRLSSALRTLVQRRTPILEPLVFVATVSLVTSWAMQPLMMSALAQQGALAQGAVRVALWLSAILSPLAALGKATAAAIVCWAIATYLDEQLPLLKLVSMFCLAETFFSLRDVAMWAVLMLRGAGGIRGTADLVVPFGINAFLHADSTLTKLAFESWDFFHIAWGLIVCWMLRAAFGTALRSSARLAIAVLFSRLLFAGASRLYGI
jgi:hypothetical protein